MTTIYARSVGDVVALTTTTALAAGRTMIGALRRGSDGDRAGRDVSASDGSAIPCDSSSPATGGTRTTVLVERTQEDP